MHNKRGKKSAKMLAAAMAVLLLAVVSPAGVLAQEQTGEEVTSPGEPTDQPEQAEVIQEEMTDGGENSIVPESGDTPKRNEEESTDETDWSADEEVETPEAIPEAVIPVVLPMTEGEQYEQLSTFLALSSDRFEIFMVVFLDAGQNQVRPEKPVEILLDIPQDYDTQRLAVSEVTVDGSTPVRTELPYEISGGKAKVTVSRAGVYVVMEKKIMQELPSYLEPTAKVEKLTLTNNSSASGRRYLKSVNSSVPLTGDDSSAAVWIVIMAAAAVSVIAIIIRKKK